MNCCKALCIQIENFDSKTWLQNMVLSTPVCSIKINTLILKRAKHVCNVNALTFMLCTQVSFSCSCYYVGCV